MIHHNDHFIFKIIRLCVVRRFLVSHRGLHKPKHFYSLSPLGTMSDLNWQAFHPREDLSLLVDTRHIFYLPLLFDRATLLDVVPFTELTQSNTKYSVNSLTMHSHPFNAMSPCICNTICHCMLYHVTCIMNATWTTLPTPLTSVMDNVNILEHTYRHLNMSLLVKQ